MNIDTAFSASTAVTGAPSGPDRTGLERMKTEELAHEFEGSMLLQMLRQMRQSMVDESEEAENSGLSNGAMMDTVDTELARQLSRNGGFGLADTMAKAITRQTAAAATGAYGKAEAAVGTAVGPTGTPHASLNGQDGGARIDPSHAAFHGSGLGGLKLTDRDADSPIGRRLATPVI